MPSVRSRRGPKGATYRGYRPPAVRPGAPDRQWDGVDPVRRETLVLDMMPCVDPEGRGSATHRAARTIWGTHIANAEFAYTGGGLSAIARGATEKKGKIRTLADDLDEADEHETVRDKVEHEQDRDRDNPARQPRQLSCAHTEA